MAAITLITLPGTFTAVSSATDLIGLLANRCKTLFSTSFFDFQPSSSGAFVSPSIWLYIVVTVSFTILCLVGWYLSSRSMSRRAEQAMRLADEQDDDPFEKVLDPPPASCDGVQEIKRRKGYRSESVGEWERKESAKLRTLSQHHAAMSSLRGGPMGPAADTRLSDGLAPARECWDVSSV